MDALYVCTSGIFGTFFGYSCKSFNNDSACKPYRYDQTSQKQPLPIATYFVDTEKKRKRKK